MNAVIDAAYKAYKKNETGDFGRFYALVESLAADLAAARGPQALRPDTMDAKTLGRAMFEEYYEGADYRPGYDLIWAEVWGRKAADVLRLAALARAGAAHKETA